MKKEKKSVLYSLLLAELGDARPSWTDLRLRLQQVAVTHGIAFTWKDELAEATSLVNEFSALLDTLQQARRADPPMAAGPGVSFLARQQEKEDLAGTFDFADFIRRNAPVPLADIARRFSASMRGSEDTVGRIDFLTAQRLLDRISAQPFTSPHAFITDPVMGVLGNAQLEELYRRETGA